MRFIKKDLMKVADSEKAKILQGFFKTGVGEYGEGNVFLGVSVPEQRRIARKHCGRIGMDGVEGLLCSGVHEERLVALLILVELFKENPKEVYDFYLGHAKFVNNWDLVDLSAPKIVGEYLLDKPKGKSSAVPEKFDFLNRKGSSQSDGKVHASHGGLVSVKRDWSVLYDLAKSDSLWERRIAIVSTFAFIRAGEFDDTLRIAKILLGDGHDLIHKAVGWMLREVGKRDEDLLRGFLRKHYDEMSRTTLRYAIERFPEDLRKSFLLGDYEGH